MDNNRKPTESTYFSKKVTFLNVFLTFFIVVLHAKTPERWGLELNSDYFFIFWMTAFNQLCVPSFFFISGLLFYNKCKFGDIERKLKSRVKSLVVPYVLWNTFFVGVYFVLSHVPFLSNRMNQRVVLNSFTEVIYAIIHSNYTDLWFVKNLILYSAFSCVIYLLLNSMKVALGVLAVSVILNVVIDFEYESIYTWFPMYFAGAIYSRFLLRDANGAYNDFCNSLMPPRRRILTLFLMICFVVLLWGVGQSNAEKYLFWYRFFSPVILWLLTDLFLRDYLVNKYTVKPWMKYMFFIYCTHHFVLNVVQKFVVMTYPPTPLVLNLTFVLSSFLVFVVLIMIARFLSRYNFYSYLSGGR